MIVEEVKIISYFNDETEKDVIIFEVFGFNDFILTKNSTRKSISEIQFYDIASCRLYFGNKLEKQTISKENARTIWKELCDKGFAEEHE